MVKVILDFQNIRESDNLDEHLQAMAESAKKANAFLFCTINEDKSASQQLYCLSGLELFALLSAIEEEHPELKMMRMMSGMMKGGEPRGPFRI